MRRVVTVGVCAVLLIGFGAAGEKGRDGPKGKSAIETEVEAWHYPNAKVLSAAASRGKLYQAVLATDDAVEKVFAHYDKQAGTRGGLSGDEITPGVYHTEGEGNKSTFFADDTTIPVAARKKGDPRGVTLRQLTRDEPGFFVTVLVSRTKDDAKTHLLVTYLKK